MSSEPIAAPEEVVAVEPTLLTPVSSGERIASIDVLRGTALLGILAINIWSFALPNIVFFDPSVAGGWQGANRVVWIVCHLLCEQKMMSLFSMLFGAGLIVLMKRSQARGTPLAGIYYRRIAWLFVIGMLHAYLLWVGDILVSYAMCGVVLYPFRRLRPRTQIAVGILVFLTQVPLVTGMGLAIRYVQEATGTHNEEGSYQLREARTSLEEALLSSRDPAKVNKEIENHHEGYGRQFVRRAKDNFWEETLGFLFWAGPRAGGLMLIGMGLMQLGVFAATRSYRFYALLTIAGYGLGLPVVGYGIVNMMEHDFDFIHQFLMGGHFNYIGSLFVALGHAGMVLLICKAGLLPRLTARLAAVGRMALSNYLMQTILCTTLFEGWGFGLFGRLDRLQLLGAAASIWMSQLIVSPVWLHHFRFGPMEWLWRSLTYGRLYPIRGGVAE
ncbi:MAG: DUF418 domain-containing protein [Gemmataceae bacterium]